MTRNLKLLVNFVEKFPRNDVDLEVDFQKSTCYIHDLKGNDLLTSSRGIDLYSITLQNTTSLNLIYLMAKASSSQAWLWHHRLSHLNFDTINLISKYDIVTGLPKLKYFKYHLCSSCELGKAKCKSFKIKTTQSSKRRLQILHMDLCGPMRVVGQPVVSSKKNPRVLISLGKIFSKFINEFFPPLRTTNLRNEISNFQQRFDESFHEAWDRYKDLLRACPHHERRTQDVLTIIENKSKVRNSRNKSNVSQVKSSDGISSSSSSSEIAKLTHGVNQQTNAVSTAMTVILKQFQATPPPTSVKAVEEICVTCGGAHPYYQCLAT
nr:retrovirus-related Pol polyprotein from transposon TNT 1-94 [Tanacetum cinerariifolium]